MIIDVECPRCNGAGEIEVSWQAAMQCPRCDGSGVVAHDLNEDCDHD
jgi:DnaJ-class molecular chaperone